MKCKVPSEKCQVEWKVDSDKWQGDVTVAL